jgi:hypothetical protein
MKKRLSILWPVKNLLKSVLETFTKNFIYSVAINFDKKKMSLERIMANLSMEDIINNLSSVENITSGRQGTA